MRTRLDAGGHVVMVALGQRVLHGNDVVKRIRALQTK